MFLKSIEEKIKVSSIQFKLCKNTKRLSAFKIQYTSGQQSTLMKAKEETDDDVQTVALKNKQ